MNEILISIFTKGFLVGLAVALPVGPMSVLCIRRTFISGKPAGFCTGLASTTAHITYGTIAAIGFHSLSDNFINYKSLFGIFSGILLSYIGLKIFFRKRLNSKDGENYVSNLSAYLSALPIAFINPITILTFVALLGSLNISSVSESFISIPLLSFGILAGSSLWWLSLCTFTGVLKDKFNIQSLHLLNKASGILIICFALKCFGG